MLFIYLLEDNPTFSTRVQQLLDRAYNRDDLLFTSYLALGEVMAGGEKMPRPQKAATLRATISGDGIHMPAIRRRCCRSFQQAARQG